MNHVLGGCAMTEPERDCVRASRETQKVEYRYIQLARAQQAEQNRRAKQVVLPRGTKDALDH